MESGVFSFLVWQRRYRPPAHGAIRKEAGERAAALARAGA
jgi:hypothetical protein